MSIDTIPVSTYMSTKGVITETIDQTIYAACRIMNKNDIGCVIIVDKSSSKSDKPVGIITERDVVESFGAQARRGQHSYAGRGELDFVLQIP